MKSRKPKGEIEYERTKKFIRTVRTLGLVFSFFMAWYLNSFELSVGITILGFLVIFIFNLVLLVYLDFWEIFSTKLREKTSRRSKRKRRRKKD